MIDYSYMKIIFTDAMRSGSNHLITLTLRASGATVTGKVNFDDPPSRWANEQVRLYSDNRSVNTVFTVDATEIASIAVRTS